MSKNVIIDGVEYTPVEKKEKLFDLSMGGKWGVKEGFNCYYITSPVFTEDDQYLKDFAEAMQVIFELKACEGVVNLKNEKQWWINGEGDVDWLSIIDDKNTELFPFFDTEENCLAAINKVGKNKIIKAMETWHKV